MAFVKNEPKRIVINLDGPEGNAFAVLAYCRSIAKQLGIDFAPIMKDAMSQDYSYLLYVMQKHFGNVIDFATNQDGLEFTDEKIADKEIDSLMKGMGYGK